MKKNQIRQIESIIKKGFFYNIKLFLICFLMNNIFIYYPFYPRVNPKKALFGIIKPSINLWCLGFCFRDFLYFDFSFSDFGLQVFYSYYSKNQKRFYKGYIHLIRYSWFRVLKNQKGFCYSDIIHSIFIWSFRILFCILLAAIFSFNDIDLPTLQEIKNDIVSSNTIQIIEKLLFQ